MDTIDIKDQQPAQPKSEKKVPAVAKEELKDTKPQKKEKQKNEDKTERPEKRNIVPMVDEKEEIKVSEPAIEKPAEELPNS